MGKMMGKGRRRPGRGIQKKVGDRFRRIERYSLEDNMVIRMLLLIAPPWEPLTGQTLDQEEIPVSDYPIEELLICIHLPSKTPSGSGVQSTRAGARKQIAKTMLTKAEFNPLILICDFHTFDEAKRGMTDE